MGLLDGDGDIQELVGGDDPGHVVAHRGQGQDAGGGAGGGRLKALKS